MWGQLAVLALATALFVGTLRLGGSRGAGDEAATRDPDREGADATRVVGRKGARGPRAARRD